MSDENAPKPVMSGSVFAAMMSEMTSMVQELAARRAFDEQVGLFLKEKKLTAKFEAWRKKQG